MGILGGKSKIKAAPHKIHVERVVVPTRPSPKPQPRSSLAPNGHASSSSSSAAAGKKLYSASPRLSPNPRGGRPKSASPYPSSADETRLGRKRKALAGTPRDSPAFGNDSDSDDNENDDPFSADKKRARRSDSRSIDINRKLRHKKAFGDEVREPRIIHAADISSVATTCKPIFGAADDEVAVELQYPSRSKPER